ncbi:MAG: bifunctional metallophosphatase/5'-nucleotidase [Lachnospiraceae bacterium]|nr:bifunctional metallophosphatase/5'-nucleotidase [Lachnospiraceae bacterium]
MKRGLAVKIISMFLVSVLMLGGCGSAPYSSGTGAAKETEQTEALARATETADKGEASSGQATETPEKEGYSTGASEEAEDGPKTEGSDTVSSDQNENGNIVILYTSDVHSGIDENMGYAGLAAYKQRMEQEGNDVILVDNGDILQGDTIGLMTKGKAIIEIMNEVGYEIAVPGNHEFDYGMEEFMKRAEEADFPFISANFKDLRTGGSVFDPYIIKELEGRKIAFIGVCAPNTITSSTPRYFQDEKGEYIYGFCQGGDGSEFYDTVQKAVDSARSEGADYCILMAHLGIRDREKPYTSTDTIQNTRGIDAVLDAHSHTVMESEMVKNADGKPVILSQPGIKFENIGKLTISPDGSLKAELINEVEERDEKVSALVEEEKSVFEAKLNEKVGKTDFDLLAKTEDGGWLIRNNETNLGDLVADAFQYVTGADCVIVNSGSIRDDVEKGEISYGSLLKVCPFNTELCVFNVTGQELLDALEYGLAFFPDDFGGFLQVSGITFDVDLDKDPGVEVDADSMFVGFRNDERRVSNVKVQGKPLDPQKTYKVGSGKYVLIDKGDGYTMFKGDKVDLDKNYVDLEALLAYFQSFEGNVPAEYAESQGRIHFLNE